MTPLMTTKFGHEVCIEYLPERAFDVKANVLDSTKLQAHIGWKPKVEFNNGLCHTSKWLRNYHV